MYGHYDLTNMFHGSVTAINHTFEFHRLSAKSWIGFLFIQATLSPRNSYMAIEVKEKVLPMLKLSPKL
jgi:hypothetical protein